MKNKQTWSWLALISGYFMMGAFIVLAILTDSWLAFGAVFVSIAISTAGLVGITTRNQ